MSRRLVARAAAALLAAVGAMGAANLARNAGSPGDTPAFAQVVDVERPRTFVVGVPSDGARSDRVDGTRRGRARTALPVAGLRTEWRVSLGMALDRAPLVDGIGNTYVVGVRGDVVGIARDGTVRSRASPLVAQAGPPAMLADGTIVFVGASGEAVAIRDGTVRWRVRASPENRRPDTARGAPLPLEDGGVVLAISRDLLLLDAEGGERARTTLAEPTALPLVAALGKVVAVTVSGAVWAWAPGASEPTRLATFGGPIDGSAALADPQTLVAVTATQTQVAAIDLRAGSAAITWAVAPAGSVWLGPPAVWRGTAHVLLLSAAGELAAEIAVGRTGRGSAELAHITPFLLRARAAPGATDGGAASLTGVPHTPPLVDAGGTVAFATIAGDVGVATPQGVDLVADVCRAPETSHADEAGQPSPFSASEVSPVVAGLAPLGPGAFVAACRSGMVVAVHGATSRGSTVPARVTAGEDAAPRL